MKNEALQHEVQALIGEVETTHRYSMSRIYAAYNEAFGKNEKPQACASCLIRKINELRRWLNEQKHADPQASEQTKPASVEDNKPRRIRKPSGKQGAGER